MENCDDKGGCAAASGDVVFQQVGSNLMALTGGPVHQHDPNVPPDLAAYTNGWVYLENLPSDLCID